MKYTQGIYILLFLMMLVATVSCENSNKEINDFLADKNLPIGVAENMYHVYKDSGKVTSKLKAKLFYDYSNRKLNPYSEFPKGVEITSINKRTRDSISVAGDYAITYNKTGISEIVGNVIVINYQENVTLKTELLYWDQNSDYYFTDKPFTLYTLQDTLTGVGFEAESNLQNWILNNTSGDFNIREE